MASIKPKPTSNLPIGVRFFRNFERTGGCWIWTGTRNKAGYGTWEIRGSSYKAHRLAYTALVGLIPDGLLVLHKCDNPPCVNPEHLFLGTHADNVLDMLRKGRHVSHEAFKTHCPHGHEYTPENTYRWGGKRDCRACGTKRRVA